MKENRKPLLRLKELRKAHGFTQDFVASKLNIARQTYSHYENGRRTPPYDCMLALAELYKLSLDELYNVLSDHKEDEANHEKCGIPERKKELSTSDFIDYCNNPVNHVKLEYLNLKERELIFYFQKIPASNKWELLEFAKILARK